MRKSTVPFLSALLAVGMFVPVDLTYAQLAHPADPRDQEIQLLKTEIKQLESRVETLEGLDQKVKVIDRKLEVEQEAQQQRALEMPIVKTSDQGFSLSSPDDSYKINFGGIVQADGRFFASGADKDVGSTFFLNRVRPILTGTLWKYYDFNITPDFGQGKVVLQDAYINMAYFKGAQIQSGKYKAPFDLERLQSDRDLEFSERSEIQNLVPNRDTGIELHSDALFKDRLTYQLAFMNGVPNNTASDAFDLDSNDGKDFVGRVYATPFKLVENEWLKGLSIGFSGSYGDERGNTTSSYKTYGMSTWFSYNKGVTASGLRARLEPQLYYHWRSFGLMAEYAEDSHSLNQFVTVGKAPFAHQVNQTDTFKDTGYMVQGSWLLTGEDATYGRLKPFHPFDPRNGYWGAWEIAARISNIANDTRQFQLGFASPNISAKVATEWALGINWYLNSNVKWQFDYANTYFDGGAGTPAVPKDRPNESMFESQLQIAF